MTKKKVLFLPPQGKRYYSLLCHNCELNWTNEDDDAVVVPIAPPVSSRSISHFSPNFHVLHEQRRVVVV